MIPREGGSDMGRTLSSANPSGENRFFGIFDTLSFDEMQQYYFGIDHAAQCSYGQKARRKNKTVKKSILLKSFFVETCLVTFGYTKDTVFDKVVKFSNRKRRRKYTKRCGKK